MASWKCADTAVVGVLLSSKVGAAVSADNVSAQGFVAQGSCNGVRVSNRVRLAAQERSPGLSVQQTSQWQ